MNSKQINKKRIFLTVDTLVMRYAHCRNEGPHCDSEHKIKVYGEGELVGIAGESVYFVLPSNNNWDSFQDVNSRKLQHSHFFTKRLAVRFEG